MSLMDLLQSNDPAIQNGLLNFGLSLMRSKGNFGNAVGQAGVAGQVGARDFRQQQALMQRASLNDQMLKNQLEQQQQQMALQKLPGQFIKPPSVPGVDATGGMETAMENPANAAGPGGVDLQGLAQAYMGAPGGLPMGLQLQQMLQKQVPTPVISKAGDIARDPKTGAIMWQNPDKPDSASMDPLTKLIAARDALPLGHPNRAIYDAAIKKAATHAPAASVTANSYGSPVAGMVNGQPGFFQTDKTGGMSVVPGVRPMPTKEEGDKAKTGRQSEQMLTAIEQARSLLKKGPTESGVGAVADQAARVFGQSSRGAQLAAQLETLSGWMVANVPRMEGPQSNFDVDNYKTMAAKVGDRTVPISERLAALNTLETLHRKYAAINGTSSEPAQSAPSAPVNWSDLK